MIERQFQEYRHRPEEGTWGDRARVLRDARDERSDGRAGRRPRTALSEIKRFGRTK